MARLDELPEPLRSRLAELDCPTFEEDPWVEGPPLPKRRVAIISTAGLHRRTDRPFEFMSGEYRVIPGDRSTNDLVMSHVSPNFDRIGFQTDWNVVFPLDRLRQLAQRDLIGSVADYHYSFMGASDPRQMEGAARALAPLLRRDRVNALLLVPV
jgi:D-proline reductase (dithiol) PrdB